jgi:8-amino-7-oxononanoate synthase
LGLSNHPGIRSRAFQAIQDFGTGSSSSPLLATKHDFHERIEKLLGPTTPQDWSIAFVSSGFAANLAFFDTLRQLGGGLELFVDHHAHASLILGARLSGLPTFFFRHRDYLSLREKLSRSNTQNKIIVTEALHSMHGTFEEPKKLAEVCASIAGTSVYMDEAHSAGTFGSASWSLSPPVLYHLKPWLSGVMLGCGKAFGAAGGILCLPTPLRNLAIQGARSLIYSTASPPATLAAVMGAIEVMGNEGQARSALLQGLLSRFQIALSAAASRSGGQIVVFDGGSATLPLDQLEPNTSKSSEFLPFLRIDLSTDSSHNTTHTRRLSPIVSARMINTPDPLRTAHFLRDHLKQNGFAVSLIRSPTVPTGTERVRISFNLGNNVTVSPDSASFFPELLAKSLEDFISEAARQS